VRATADPPLLASSAWQARKR